MSVKKFSITFKRLHIRSLLEHILIWMRTSQLCVDTCILKVKSTAKGKFWYLALGKYINVKEILITSVCSTRAFSMQLQRCWHTFLHLVYLTQFYSSHQYGNNTNVCILHSIVSIFHAKVTLLPCALLLQYQLRTDIASYRFYFYSFGIYTNGADDTKYHIDLLPKCALPLTKCFTIPFNTKGQSPTICLDEGGQFRSTGRIRSLL